MKVLKSVALATPVVLGLAGSVAAQDVFIESADRSVTLSGGIGVLAIESREYVYRSAGSSDLLSLLIWQSTAPLLTTSLDVQLPSNWSFTASANVALAGNSHMEDYDWLLPIAGTPDMSNWSHQSVHPDTALDWYFNGSVQAAYTFEHDAGPDIRVFGGLEYTDVQWTGYGGTFNYAGVTGTFGPGRVITYRQQFPALMTGANAIFESGDWVFDVGAKAGVTFGAKATDDHWLRDIRFIENVYLAPVLGASAKATYAVSDNLDFFVGGQVDRIFLGRSDTNMFNIPTGAPLGGTAFDASGADLISANMKVGLSGSF
jgi:outer membrane protease